MSLLFTQHIMAAATQVDVRSLPHVNADSNEISKIISTVLVIAGGICVLIITIAGLRYILANGDPQAVSSAKNTIIYALVGLIISASSIVIVNFVLGRL